MQLQICRKNFISLIILSVLLGLLYCQEKKEQVILVENDEEEYPSQEGWQSEHIFSIAGRRQAVVHCGHVMKYDESKKTLFDEGVEVDFYDEEGNHTSHLTSERGEYNEETEDIIGMGNVIVESDSGVTLRTEVLRWDNHLEKIISDTLVMVTTPDQDTLYGTGFESNADLTRRIIHNPWGTSSKSVDIDEIESSFSSPAAQDSVADEYYPESLD